MTCNYSERGSKSAPPLKSSQSLFVTAERLFTFQPGLHPGYNAPVLKSVSQRAIRKVLTLAVEINFLVEIGRIAHNVLQLQKVGDFGDENCLPAVKLILSTKLYLTTEPAFLPNTC